jgi:DNA-binding PadR family transcriptional regulator
VLLAVTTVKGGASIPGLKNGLKLLAESVIMGNLKGLEAEGLIYSQLEPSRTDIGKQIRRYYPSNDLELKLT